MGIKNWFTKKSKVVKPAKQTRLYDIYGEQSNIDYLEAKLKEIENTLNNLPQIPDLSDYAVKSQDNTFSGSNTFTKAIKCETFPEISKGNYEPTANKQLAPKYYVDKKVNDNIAGLDNKVQMLHNQQQAGINHLNDITAKKNETNRFQQPQEIAREVIVYGDHNASAAHITFKNISTNERIGYIGKASLASKDITLKCETGNLLCDNLVADPKSVATKEYVDKFDNRSFVYTSNKGGRMDIYQTGNIFFHCVPNDINFTISTRDIKKGFIYTVIVMCSISSIGQMSNAYITCYTTHIAIYDNIQNITVRIPSGTSWTSPYKGSLIVGQNPNTSFNVKVLFTPSLAIF